MRPSVPRPNQCHLFTPLAAGLALVSVGSASAQIVYSGIQDLTVTYGSTPGNGLSVDLNNDGTPDINFSISPTGVTTKPAVTTLSSGTTVSGTPAVGPFPDSLQTYSAGASIMGNYSPQTGGPWFDAGDASSTVYVGFTLSSGTTSPLYGWAQITSTDATDATLVDWAYNATPGGDIDADQTMSAVPEPADTALWMGGAALLAGSVAVWRKRERSEVAA